MWVPAKVSDASAWALPRPDNLSSLPRLPYEFPTRPVHDVVFSDKPAPHTRYVAVQGQSLSNNRRQAPALAAIAANALNRTLLVCDRPIVELYDLDALRSVVPVQVTYAALRTIRVLVVGFGTRGACPRRSATKWAGPTLVRRATSAALAAVSQRRSTASCANGAAVPPES